MLTNLNPTPLIGDPARQAPDLHKGLVYQIWRSVEAWINLKENELLFLEGAEDYDVVSNASGTAVQVKATVGNITLRSEAIIAALNSFWLIKNNHPEKQIWVRFITTSPITTEQGNPFGADAGGLEIWTQCAKSKDLALAERLRRFLTTDPIVSPQLDKHATAGASGSNVSLLQYLKATNAAAVLDEIITHIVWKTGSEDSDVVKENVAIHLRAFGEEQRLRPNECEPAKDHLFRIVAETASKKQGRVLSRDEFRLEFQEVTSKRYSASELAALTANAGLLQQAVSSSLTSGGDLILAATTLVQIGVPALPPDFVKRGALVAKVLDVTSTCGGVVIKGSSGMGKSTLAKLAATTAGGQWIWADFQGIDSSNVPQMVRLFANHLIQSSSEYNLALDNLDFEVSDLAGIDNSLAAVVRSVRSRAGKFIITTQRDLPGRLLQKMLLTKASVVDIPYFTDAEIEEFCLALGCNKTKKVSLLAKIVRVQTSGHPQLVHARLVGLALNSWPLPKAEDIMTQPPEVVQELDVARQLLDAAPSDDKQLLYRLSITTGWFRKDHVLAIAQIEPPLRFAGDSFTRLVGPWIEVVGGEYYRLSPLLSKAAERNWSAEAILSFRSHIARAFLSCGKKTLLEANEVLLQGLLAQDEVAVTSVLIGLGQVPLNAGSQIADQFFWLTAVGYKNGKMAFPKNPFVNLLLRLLQFRIVVERSPEDADWLCEAVDRETTHLKEEVKNHSRIMWTSHVMIFYQATIRAKTLIDYWSETIDLLAVDPAFAKLAKKSAKAMDQVDGLETRDFLGNSLLMILARDNNPQYLLEFAQSVDALPIPKRNAAIGYMRQMPRVLQLAVDRSWLKESDKTSPDWSSALTCYVSIQQIAVKWKHPDLAALAYRAIAVIQDEYLNDPGKAFEAADNGIALDSNQKRVLEDQKAMIFYRQNRYAEAIKIWERILPTWVVQENSREMQPLFICQRAGNAAGHLQDWPSTIKFFELGQQLAKKTGSQLHELTFLADKEHVLWKCGQKKEAVTELASVVERLEKLRPDKEDDFQFHRAWKSIEQVVKWCCQDSGENLGVETYEPPIGFCSKPEGDEKLRDIPKAPIDFLWLFLAQTELRIGAGRKIFNIVIERAALSTNILFRSTIARFKISADFRGTMFSSFIDDIMALEKALSDVRLLPNFPAQSPPTNRVQLIEEALVAALVVLASSNKALNSFVLQWSAAITKFSTNDTLNSIIPRLKTVLDSDATEVHKIYRASANDAFVLMLASLRLAINSDESLEKMLLGQGTLLSGLSTNAFKKEISEAVGNIFKKSWELRVGFPAGFPTPRLTIPPIKAACAEPVSGFRLAARIFLHARHSAPRIPVPSSMLKQFEDLAR